MRKLEAIRLVAGGWDPVRSSGGSAGLTDRPQRLGTQRPLGSEMNMAAITAEHIREEVKKLIAEVTEREPEEITDTALFADELGVDSLMAMEVMVAVDKKYKINIPEDEFAKIKNVNDTVEVVQRHMELAASA